MKRVLILAAQFPPYDTPGVRRPVGLYKHLPDFGWEPWVITIDPTKGPNPYHYKPCDSLSAPANRVIRTGFSSLAGQMLLGWMNRLKPESTIAPRIRSKEKAAMEGVSRLVRIKGEIRKTLGRFAQALLSYPDSYYGWYRHALKAAQSSYIQAPYQALISTSVPETTHLVASKLKSSLNSLVWVADFRDLWSQKYSSESPWFRAFMDKRLEQRTLSYANAITATSAAFIKKQALLHPSLPNQVIMNGFDPEDYTDLPNKPLSEKLVVTHAGHIYQGYRDPIPLLQALATLIAAGRVDPLRLEIRFLGFTSEWLQGTIEKLGLSNCVKTVERVPRQDALKQLALSSVLWVLDWEDARETGNIPAKIFEYMGSRRYILATGGTVDSEIGRLLRVTGGGQHLPNDPDAIANCLEALYQRFVGLGVESFIMSKEQYAVYTHRAMAARFAKLLDLHVEKDGVP
jgi:hypothetical protein